MGEGVGVGWAWTRAAVWALMRAGAWVWLSVRLVGGAGGVDRYMGKGRDVDESKCVVHGIGKGIAGCVGESVCLT